MYRCPGVLVLLDFCARLDEETPQIRKIGLKARETWHKQYIAFLD